MDLIQKTLASRLFPHRFADIKIGEYGGRTPEFRAGIVSQDFLSAGQGEQR
jgi:hypothetical protein